MRKSSLKNLLLTSAFLFFCLDSNAQDSEATDTKTNKSAKSSSDFGSDSPSPPAKKLKSVAKPLENSSLVDNIQGDMANLLLGNKTTSLMFDDKENDNIERAIDSYKSNQTYVPENDDETSDGEEKKKEDSEAALKEKKEQDEFNAKSYIYLASIMYSTPQNWVVWINDRKITSESNKKNKELFLNSVQKDQVSILWNVSPSKLKVLLGKKADDLRLKTNENGQIEVKFTLQQNQTFILGSNSVVEGKIVTNLIKKKDKSPLDAFQLLGGKDKDTDKKGVDKKAADKSDIKTSNKANNSRSQQ